MSELIELEKATARIHGLFRQYNDVADRHKSYVEHLLRSRVALPEPVNRSAQHTAKEVEAIETELASIEEQLGEPIVEIRTTVPTQLDTAHDRHALCSHGPYWREWVPLTVAVQKGCRYACRFCGGALRAPMAEAMRGDTSSPAT
jgi:hypothetical protein